MQTAIKIIALIASGLLAGAFFYTFINLIPTFNEVRVNVHLIFRVQLMSHNGITMPLLMGLCIVLPLVFAWLNRRNMAVRDFALLNYHLLRVCLYYTYSCIPMEISR